MSVAVATPTGLLVPVLRNCQNKGFHDIEKVTYLLI
jgi:pyruvate/2-oxoglutarate dehydrogenase complex dihydrolipoamide acyltransferase (E2) component